MNSKNRTSWFIVVAALSIVSIVTVVIGKAVYTALELIQLPTKVEARVSSISQLTEPSSAKESPQQIQTSDSSKQSNKLSDIQVSKEGTESDEQQSKQIEYEEKVKEIEVYIAKQKQKVENNYAWQIFRLQQMAEARLAELNFAEKSALARFNQSLKNTISETYGSVAIDGSARIDGHIDGYGYIDGYGSSYERTRTYVVGDPAKDYTLETGRITNAKLNTLQDFEYELARLQAAKEQDFARLDRLEELYKTNVRQAIFYIKPPFGTVTGIAYGKDKQSVIIDGKIFHIGDTVQGIKVLKIRRRQVDFEKNGKRWTQEINQAPSPYWE